LSVLIDRTVNSPAIDYPIIVLVGPTAIGKTALSLQLVKRFDCEIISMDSMQIYRYMDIGTAKPDRKEQELVPHHLIDIVDPDDHYDAARFVNDCLKAITEIGSRRRTILLTGGTGFYLKALTEGLCAALPSDDKIKSQLEHRLQEEGRAVLHEELCRVDPVTGARVHVNDTQRLLRGLEIYQVSGKTWSELIKEQKEKGQGTVFNKIVQIALTCERDELYQDINRRSELMLGMGLVEEVEKLRSMGYGPQLASMQAIGYRHVNNMLSGLWDRQTMLEHMARDTRRYAKRQLTWFSGNKNLHWFDRKDKKKIARYIAERIGE
jgi:tRNA dimethylallyltransferase